MAEHRRRSWEESAPEESDINFLREMVLSPTSGYGLLGAVIGGAVLSIPLGLGVGALPLLGYAAVEAIAALFVPASPVFRDRVLRRKRMQSLEATQAHLLQELRRRASPEAVQWRTWDRMGDRLRSLRKLAASRDTGLSERDVHRLVEAMVDYLGLWLAWLAMGDRYRNTDEDAVRAKIEKIGRALERQGIGAVEQKRLNKAQADLVGILQRRDSLWARATSIEAAMLAMADTFEEVYHRVVANPSAGAVSSELGDAVERMRVEEALDLAVDEELESLMHRQRAHRASAQQTTGVA